MAGEKKIRVLVVDDSAFMRKVLEGIIASDPMLEVCGEARDGKNAVSQIEALNPDVISMDINMPVMDGLQATEIIMSTNPKPILIVSSESREGAEVTLKALQLGAIDFVSKPSGGIDLDMSAVREELVRKLKMAAKVRVVRTATRARVPQNGDSAAPPVPRDDSRGAASAATTAKALRQPDTLGASGRQAWRGKVPDRSGGIVNGRAGHVDEVCPAFCQGISRRRDCGPAYAGQFHLAVQRAVAGSLPYQGQGSGSGRNDFAGPALCLPGFASSPDFIHWQGSFWMMVHALMVTVPARTWPWAVLLITRAT